jgi:flagellar biosynthesis component FlhA
MKSNDLKGKMIINQDNRGRQMINWNIVKKFALVFGIVFIVFTVLSALINYVFDNAYYMTTAPLNITLMSIFAAMLPYLLAAVLSFAVVILSSRAAKSEAKKEPEAQEKETQETEMQEKEKQETETQEVEDVFKEAPT